MVDILRNSDCLSNFKQIQPHVSKSEVENPIPKYRPHIAATLAPLQSLGSPDNIQDVAKVYGHLYLVGDLQGIIRT